MTRAERAAQAAELRAEGLTYQQVGDAMGISRSYAGELCLDPEGERVRERKDSCTGSPAVVAAS